MPEFSDAPADTTAVRTRIVELDEFTAVHLSTGVTDVVLPDSEKNGEAEADGLVRSAATDRTGLRRCYPLITRRGSPSMKMTWVLKKASSPSGPSSRP